MTDPRRFIPPVDRLLESEAFGGLAADYPRQRVVAAVRRVLEAVRREAAADAGPPDPSDPVPYARRARRLLERDDRPSLRPVVNATGVVLHTNLGRAPLAVAARTAMVATAGYANLEYDLDEGRRGSRYVHCADLLTELTGAGDALVVNNGAAALVLALNTLARGRPVLVSRGELVEIGGGFRIPEMLERAGARLVEVGSTNRTRLEDYRRAAGEAGGSSTPEGTGPGAEPAMVLKVHRSNFRISGFTEEASLAELAGWTRERGLPLVHDLGSGLLVDPELLGLPHEPRPADSLDAGADLVAFSGDKLLGGPQAGIVLGDAALVEALRRNPLCRALRVDKGTLAALEATLRLYRDPARAVAEIPALAALARTPEELDARARRLAGALRAAGVDVEVVESRSVPGGGTYPGVELPSRALALAGDGTDAGAVAAALRDGEPPVVGRVEEGRLLLDLRTVAPEEDATLLARITEVTRHG